MQKESMDKSLPVIEAGSGEVGKELKRNIWVVSVILALVLMIASWKEFVLPELATAFTSAHPNSNVSNLLMVVGALASVCIILTIVMIAVLYKMYILSKQITLVELEVGKSSGATLAIKDIMREAEIVAIDVVAVEPDPKLENLPEEDPEDANKVENIVSNEDSTELENAKQEDSSQK